MNVKQIVLAERPKGLPTKETFRTETVTVPTLQDGEVKVKAKYFSVDPYMRGRMNDVKSYAPPFQVNAPVYGTTIAEIAESKATGFETGDLIKGVLPWATESVVNSKSIIKIDTSIAPPTYYLGILGMPGLTAFFGLL